MKQLEMVSNGGDQEVVATMVGGGSKRNEDKMKVSPNNDKGKGDPEPSYLRVRTLTERESRKKLRNMFHELHALLPQLPSKANQSTIVDEAASYIKTLQQNLQNLITKKRERLYDMSSNTTISSLAQPQSLAHDTRESFLADQGASSSHFGIVSPPNPTSFPNFPKSSPTNFQTWTFSNVTLNMCGLDAHISICSSKSGLLATIFFVLEKHNFEIVSTQISSDQSKSMYIIHAHANGSDQFMETFTNDEVYKQVAKEIMHCVDSESS